MVNIYCTLGPSCSDSATLEAMVLAGLTGVRLNLSHAGLEQEQELISTVQTAFAHCEQPMQLIIDLQGAELRVGKHRVPVPLTDGTYVALDKLGLPDAVRDVLEPGQELLLDDGKLLLSIEDATYAFVRRGGILSSHKSVAIAGSSIDLPPFTESDLANLKVAKDFGVTGVMQPFVHNRADLDTVRAQLDSLGCEDVRLYAKLENMAGVDHLEELLPAADEFVIARGDLGNAMPLWNLPATQKRIAGICNQAGKPFMVATQLLSSMESSAIPTRAEVSDIFNAVLDGAGSLMATGETAVGAHPVDVVRYLVDTARAATTYKG